jgi:hypothetical protein
MVHGGGFLQAIPDRPRRGDALLPQRQFQHVDRVQSMAAGAMADLLAAAVAG